MPHGSLPQINSIAPIQLRAPMEYPHKSISSFTSSQCRTPMACPYKSIPSPWFSPSPPWCVPPVSHPNGVPPQINPISLIQSCAPMTYPHKSIPSPHKSIPSLWSSRTPMPCPSQCHIPMACPLKSIPSPQSRARFLSLSQNVLRNCLSQDCSETCLRSLSLSVFYLRLRQKIVLQIQIQALVNTVAPIKYLIFLKTSMIKRNFIFTKSILILVNYCCIIEHKIFFRLFVTQA